MDGGKAREMRIVEWLPADLVFGKVRSLGSTALSGRCGSSVERGEEALDAGQGGRGLLGSVAVVQRLPSALHFLQDLDRGRFPLIWLGGSDCAVPRTE